MSEQSAVFLSNGPTIDCANCNAIISSVRAAQRLALHAALHVSVRPAVRPTLGLSLHSTDRIPHDSAKQLPYWSAQRAAVLSAQHTALFQAFRSAHPLSDWTTLCSTQRGTNRAAVRTPFQPTHEHTQWST